MARIDPTKLNLEEKVVQINRVAKVVKGGRRFSFSAVVVVGDRNGVVGATIPHEVRHDYGASHVMLKPASAGTGVIAGGSVRSVVEAAGVRDLLSKSMGSTNPVNVVRATIEALSSLRSADAIASARGKTAEELLGKRAAEAARRPHEYVERPAPAFPQGGGRGR